MREGAVTIRCHLSSCPVAATCVNHYGSSNYFSCDPPRCNFHRLAFPPMYLGRYEWDYYLPLLQPALATDEEVLMVEMMCHGFASLGTPGGPR